MNKELRTEEGANEKLNLRKEIFSWLETILISVIAVALIITFVARMMRIDGISMEPTLYDQERVITLTPYGGFKHNDIVVIRRKGKSVLVKRVVALAGDTVDIDYDHNRLIVNGEPVEEPFTQEAMQEVPSIRLPAVVPEGCVFVLGDNRNHSSDSRDPDNGMIDERNIFGKVVFRVWPLSRWGKVDAEDYTY